MKNKRFVHKIKFYFWVLLFVAYSVTAAGVMIDALHDNYRDLSQVAVTTADSPAEIRMSGATQIAAVYRAQSGAPFSSLPPGSTFKVVWPDGSSEYVTVISQSSGTGVQPVLGTQRIAPEPGAPTSELQIVPVDPLDEPDGAIEFR